MIILILYSILITIGATHLIVQIFYNQLSRYQNLNLIKFLLFLFIFVFSVFVVNLRNSQNSLDLLDGLLHLFSFIGYLILSIQFFRKVKNYK